MAANTINQLSTANTFQHWLNATELLIATANLLTNGNGEAFYANTRLIIGGSGANVSLNVETSATINTQTSNTVNTVNATVRNLVVTANVENVNVTNDLFVGDDLTVYGESTLVGDTTISGNLTVSGNLTLDTIGFDDQRHFALSHNRVRVEHLTHRVNQVKVTSGSVWRVARRLNHR